MTDHKTGAYPDARIRGVLDDDRFDYVDVHEAACGCFLARAERSDNV